MRRSAVLFRQALMMALIYMLFDLPFRMTGFLSLDGWAGPKNFLPVMTGLMFGPAGAAGVTFAALVSPLAMGVGIREAALESLIAAAAAFGTPFLWYTPKSARQFRLKTTAEHMKYALILCLFAVLGGGLALLIEGGGFWETALSFFAWGLLLGGPILILIMSVFGFRPVCAAKYRIPPDIDAVIPNTPEGIGSVNYLIYDLVSRKKIDRKRCFNIMTCVEELLIRINANADQETKITVTLYAGDVIFVSISFGGSVKYNPLFISKTESREDTLGLTLLKLRALRANYSFRDKINRIDVAV